MSPIFNTVPDLSMVELFFEFDIIPKYYKFMAAAANWVVLAGLISFPDAFDDGKDKLQGATAIRVIVVCLLVFGIFWTGFLCWKWKNLVFQFELIFKPGLSNSTIGLLASLFRVYGKLSDSKMQRWPTSVVVAIILSCTFIILYGVAVFIGNRKLDAVRALDEWNRQMALGQEHEDFLPEEERMRRNLLGLLLSPQPQLSTQYQSVLGTSANSSSSPHPTPAAVSQVSFSSTSYPPFTPTRSAASSHPLMHTSNYGQATTPTDPIAEMMADSDRSKENVRPGWVYPSLRGGYRNVYTNESQRPSLTRSNSIFAGISGTIGRGRERVGAAWNSWAAA